MIEGHYKIETKEDIYVEYNSEGKPVDVFVTGEKAKFLRNIAETRRKAERGELPNVRISGTALDSQI